MTRHRILVLILTIIILFAGCSGLLPSESSDINSTQESVQTVEQTPTIAPEETPTATQTATPTATPTPSPKVEHHRLLARQIATELQKNSAETKSWVRDVSAGTEYSAVLVRQPPEWTVKRTEMEAVREAVRGVMLGTKSSVKPAEMNGSDLHRPNEIQIVVQSQQGEITTRLSLDTQLAVAYADEEVSLKEFATQLNNTRKVERDIPLGENSTAYYLKMAEWRQIRSEQIRIINLRENFTVEIDRSELRPERDEVYYYYTPTDSGQWTLQDTELLRTYWEAVRNVSRQGLVHRFPERMRLYADVPGDDDVETTIRTEYAIDFIQATDGDISDENILLNGKYNLYYSKANYTEYADK